MSSVRRPSAVFSVDDDFLGLVGLECASKREWEKLPSSVTEKTD